MEAGLFSAEGRIRRTTFWLRWLFVFVINISLRLIIEKMETPVTMLFLLLVMLLLSIFIMLQFIKRMHDVNKSGWYIMIPFYNLILALTPGTLGRNEYGLDPKGDGIDHESLDALEPIDAIEKPVTKNAPLNSDTMIMVFVGYAAFNILVNVLMQWLFPSDWYTGTSKYIQIMLNLGLGVMGILLSVSVRKADLRVFAIIAASIWFLTILYRNVEWILQSF